MTATIFPFLDSSLCLVQLLNVGKVVMTTTFLYSNLFQFMFTRSVKVNV